MKIVKTTRALYLETGNEEKNYLNYKQAEELIQAAFGNLDSLKKLEDGSIDTVIVPSGTITASQQPQYYLFWCPGCQELHPVHVDRKNHKGPIWGWNGREDRPTFTPSLLLQGTRFTEKGQAAYNAWAKTDFKGPRPTSFESKPHVCHSYVTDGKIQFLSDCTHELRGKTVELPEDPINQASVKKE